MDKINEFKDFIKNKEFLIDKVNNKETTWQDLYQIYDLYGENASIFKDVSVNNENKISSLLKAFEGVDVNKINENLEGVRKILTVLGEFSKKDEGKVKRSYDKPNSNYDD